MLALERPKIAFPELLSIHVESVKVHVGSIPDEGINALTVDSRRRGRQRILRMGSRLGRADWKGLGPERFAVERAQAEKHSFLAVLAGGLQEQTIPPNHRRRIARSGNLLFPQNSTLAEPNRNVAIRSDARAIGPAKSRPCRIAGERSRRSRQTGKEQSQTKSRIVAWLATSWSGKGTGWQGRTALWSDTKINLNRSIAVQEA